MPKTQNLKLTKNKLYVFVYNNRELTGKCVSHNQQNATFKTAFETLTVPRRKVLRVAKTSR